MKSLTQLCIMVVSLVFCLSAAGAKYPLKVSSVNPRILVDQTNAPFLLVGDAPHSLIVNVSQPDAAFYLANRRTNGFNSLWVELLCFPYTGGRANGSMTNGTLPFTKKISGTTNYDLTAPNEAYFAYVDTIIRMAATNGIQVILDPLDTGWSTIDTQTALDNGTTNCRVYGQYLGNRYKNFPNLIWLSGNDFQGWRTAANDAVIMAVASGIKDKDTNHLQTVELDYYVSSSFDDANWEPIIGLNLAYTYYPTYAEVLHAYQQSTNTPVFMGEAHYEFESVGGDVAETGTPLVLRHQEYWTMLSGAVGQIYGNGYTWPFKNGWQIHLDSTGVAQLKYATAFFMSHAWYNLVPDINHMVLTSGYGTYATSGSVSANDYAPAASAGDGTLALVYVPTVRTVTMNLGPLRGVVTAQWFDPVNGTYLPINGSPFFNTGTQNFTPPGSNSAGDPDWVLVLTADVTKPTLKISMPTTGQRWSNSVFNITGTAADNVQVSNVTYQINGLGWDPTVTTNHWTNWTAQANLSPGTNIIQARAMDTSGTFSTTNQVSLYYVPVAMLTVQTNGHGFISPNYNGVTLLVGSNYTMTATAATGFSFAGWSGSNTTNGATLKFIMSSNLNFTANFKDVTKPALAISTPTNGQRWSNVVFTMKGTASDNVQVSNMLYSLNGGPWINADTTNNWTNWTAQIGLVPGTNHLSACATDVTGNKSATNRLNFDFVVTNQLVLGKNGLGTFSPNYSNAWLEIGRNYSMTATPGSGFVFSNWTSSVGWVSNTSLLNFMMQSDLMLMARFVDVTKPALTITAPAIGQRWSNAMFVVQGKASDNFAVSSVTFILNNDAWTNAIGTTNWSATVNLMPGTNHLSAYATDIAGNKSATNSLSFDFVITNQLVLGKNGLGTFLPNYSNVWLELGRNYSMTATSGSGFVFSNWTSSVGWVSNTSLLNFMMQSNLMLTARFVDVTKPVLTITAPAGGQRMTNALANVKGLASDNWKVAGVWYQANGKAWNAATSSNTWTNWAATIPLVAGTNKLLAYAVDLAGNTSTTNSISLISSNTFKFELAPASLQSMTGNGWSFSLQVSTGLNGTIQASTDLVNWVVLGNFVGTNSAVNINDLTASNYNLRFYRAVVQ